MATESQNKKILRHLSSGKKLTAYGALKMFNCFRLSARINDIRSDGHNIQKETLRTPQGKNVAEYYMEEEIKLG